MDLNFSNIFLIIRIFKLQLFILFLSSIFKYDFFVLPRVFILSWVSWLGCLEYIFSPRDISWTNSSWFPHFINKRQVVGFSRRCSTTFIQPVHKWFNSVVNRVESLKKTKILNLKLAFLKLCNSFIKIGKSSKNNRYIVEARSFMQCFWTVLWSFFFGVF